MSEQSRQCGDDVPEPLRHHVESHFTRAQMAAAYGCDQETISRWVDKRQLPTPIRYGARDVWTLESLEEHRRQRALKAEGDSDRVRRTNHNTHIAGRAQ